MYLKDHALKNVFSVFSLCALVACGGGGSDTGSANPVPVTPPTQPVPPVAPVPPPEVVAPVVPPTDVTPVLPIDPVPPVVVPALTFSPNKLSAIMPAGTDKYIDLTIIPNALITQNVFVNVRSLDGALPFSEAIVRDAGGSFTTRVKLSSALPLGRHTGNLEVRLCRDKECASQFPGSPVALPYDVQVNAVETGVVLVPGKISMKFYSGEGATVKAIATTTRWLGGEVYMRAVDPKGVLTPSTSNFQWIGDYSYEFTVSSKPALSKGRYTGDLNVRLCRDPECSAEYPGSPVKLPYDVDVLAATNLTALSRWNDVPDWSTFQGNAAHTAYVPVTLDPNRFIRRWEWTAPTGFNQGNPPHITTMDGLFFITAGSTVYARKESNGAVVWEHLFNDATSYPSPPAAAYGTVYVGFGNKMYSFNATNGALRQTQAGVDPRPNYLSLPPIPDRTSAYFDGDANGVPVQGAGGLKFFHTKDSWGRDEMLKAVNGANIAWTVPGSYFQYPAYAGSVVYALGSGKKRWSLEARAETTGALLWTWEPPTPAGGFPLIMRSYGSLLATKNLIFVSIDGQTRAIDLVTRQAVWSYPMIGNLALSANGVLYITDPSGNIAAFNVK